MVILDLRRSLTIMANKKQAPTAPKKRTSIRTKTSSTPTSHSGSGLMPRPHREGAVIGDSFSNSKVDKRTIKHSAFVNRIEKANKKPLKRRRPNKKLVTTLESLADALPSVDDLVKRKEGGKVEMKSLSHGRGFMKRRGKVEKEERERFGKNLGVIMGNSGGENPPPTSLPAGSAQDENVAPKPSATAGRFAAIRAWVNTNMEKHEDFEKKD